MRRLAVFTALATIIAIGTASAQQPRPRQPQPATPAPRPAPRRQTPPPPPPPKEQKVRVSFNAGTQIGSSTASQNFSLPIDQENASILNDIDLTGGMLFDFGGAYKVTRTLWAGVSLSLASRQVDSDLSAAIPHPFFFNLPRQIDDTVTDLENKETAIHISVGYLKTLSPTLEVMVFAGPSIFNVSQDLVTDIDYASDYPYDTATLASVTTTNASGSAFGFNVGADISYKLTTMMSVGGLVRFTRGSTTLDADADNQVDISAGGLTVGGGIRVKF